MKQIKQAVAKKPILKGVVQSKWRRTLLLVVVAALALGISGYVVWQQTRQEAPLTEAQQRSEDNIPSQEQFLNEVKDGPKDMRALAYANLAQSYAHAKQCSKAYDALGQAKELAPKELATSMKLTEEYVKGLCP